ncbi:MAG: hypothetical protein WC323_03285 [Patescibacteria group bacterium]
MAWGCLSKEELTLHGGGNCPFSECRGRLRVDGMVAATGQKIAVCNECDSFFCAYCGKPAEKEGGTDKYCCACKT